MTLIQTRLQEILSKYRFMRDVQMATRKQVENL